VLAAAVKTVTMMYAVNIVHPPHNEDVPQQRISTFGQSFCCWCKQDCQAASANATPTEINGRTVGAATPQRVGGKMRFAAEYLRLRRLAWHRLPEKPIHPTH
jgi:hypothetical protein